MSPRRRVAEKSRPRSFGGGGGSGWAWAVLWVPGILLATLFITIPGHGPVTLSGDVTAVGSECGYGCVAITSSEILPGNVNATIRWVDVSGGQVMLVVYGPHGVGVVCDESGSNGRCSFLSWAGTYQFTAGSALNTHEGGQLVDYWITYLES